MQESKFLSSLNFTAKPANLGLITQQIDTNYLSLGRISITVMHAAAERRRRRFFCHAADAEKNARRDSA